jgi:hypothetical protein
VPERTDEETAGGADPEELRVREDRTGAVRCTDGKHHRAEHDGEGKIAAAECGRRW